jgi:hypothetical protein
MEKPQQKKPEGRRSNKKVPPWEHLKSSPIAVLTDAVTK